MPMIAAPVLTALAAATLSGCSVTDGDGIRCAPLAPGLKGESIRLLGIDTPEMPGHCRRGRRCATGDPIAARDALRQTVRTAKRLTIRRMGSDKYGRTLGVVWAVTKAGPVNLSCEQLRLGHAEYKPAWDDGATIARLCPLWASPPYSRTKTTIRMKPPTA